MRYLQVVLLFCAVFISLNSFGQSIPNPNCPQNIGFESGTFNNWSCSAGSIARDGNLNLVQTGPIADRHTLIANSYPQEVDPYGGFPVNCPNGSGYSIRLGNSSAGGQAEGVSYTFNIPVNNNDYGIIYNYAVVFQNPPHQSWEQPRFTSRVYNVTDNKYIDCGSFQFNASGNLPGFILSGTGNNVFYKPWSPVTVSLIGLAGKTVRLEFYTNDCAFTQHFGYAYVDVNEDCSSSPISGSTVCGRPQSITLTAPFGFATYSWFSSDFSQSLGHDNILAISPAPPGNTKYALVVTPYDGLGCEDTLYSTINISNEPFNLNVTGDVTGCSGTGLDLTSSSITAGSTPGLTYYYFTNLNQTEYVPVPTKVDLPGTYYIKGINSVGCNDIKPVRVSLTEAPSLLVTNPAGVCQPLKVDLTDPAVTAGSESGLNISYWHDQAATVPLTNPSTIGISGRYYIMGQKLNGCGIVKPVDVKIGVIPNIVIHNPTKCGKVDLTDTSVTSGSTPNITYSYWTDAATTTPLLSPTAVTTSGIYYLTASAPSGCAIVRPVSVTVNPIPDFIVTDPPAVTFPVQTINITTAVNQNSGLVFTYWLDSATRKAVVNPLTVNKRGRYFIRATNEFGCSIIKGVNAVILPPPSPIIYAPNAFTPNNDGVNDEFKITVLGETSINYFRVFNRWGQLVYDNPNLSVSWNGKLKNIDLPAGVYVWILGGLDTYFKKPFMHKGSLTLLR